MPTHVADYQLSSGSGTTVSVTDSAAGEILVATVVDQSSTSGGGINVSGGPSWNRRGYIATSSRPGMAIFTATATGGSFTLTISGGATPRSAVVTRWSNASLSASPTLLSATSYTGSITTSAASSAIQFAVGDWSESAVTSTTYSTATAGAATQVYAYKSTGNHSVWHAYHANAGAAAAKTVGLVSPTTAEMAVLGIEILDGGGGGGGGGGGAVVYRSGSGNYDSGSGTTFTIPVPSGITADDLLVAVTCQDSDGAIANLTAGTSGFTQLGTDGAEVGTSPAARAWWKVATGAESGSFTFGCDGNASAAGAIACLYGANNDSPIDVTTSWSSGTGSTETAPTITVAAGSMLVTAYIEQGGSGHAHSQPTGMTEVADPASSWQAMAMDVEARASAGPTGTRPSTLTGTLNGNWRTVSFSIAPGAGGPTTWTKSGAAIAPWAGTGTRTRITLTKAGGGATGAAGHGAKSVTSPAGIAPVGSLAGSDAVGVTDFTVSTTAVGNAIILGARINSSTKTITSLTGGGCTWEQVGHYVSTLRGRSYDIWIGQVIAVVTDSTISTSWSSDISSNTLTFDVQEFTNGPPSTWARDGSQTGGVETSSTSTTLNWPTLSATAANELYFGQGSVNTGTPTSSGTPPGFVFAASTRCWMYGVVSGSGSISPTQTTGSNATFGAVAALITATEAANTYQKYGGSITAGAGSGPRAGSRFTVTGGGIGAGASSGARAGTRIKAGGASVERVGTGTRTGTRTKSGGAVTIRAGSGLRIMGYGPKRGGAVPAMAGTGDKAGSRAPRAGGGLGGARGTGYARVTSDWCFATTATVLADSWTAPQQATGPTTGDFAIWTGPGAHPGASGTLELAGFPAHEPLIPSIAVPDVVSIKVRHAEGPLDQIAAVNARVYVGSTPVGASQPLTPLTYPHEDTITVSGLSYTDLTNLRVRIIVTRI